MTSALVAQAKGLSAAQRRDLALVCRTNGGGVRIRCRVLDGGEAVPASSSMRKLYEKGLIQGKAGGWESVVHTRDGLELYRFIVQQQAGQ